MGLTDRWRRKPAQDEERANNLTFDQYVQLLSTFNFNGVTLVMIASRPLERLQWSRGNTHPQTSGTARF